MFSKAEKIYIQHLCEAEHRAWMSFIASGYQVEQGREWLQRRNRLHDATLKINAGRRNRGLPPIGRDQHAAA